MQIEIKKTNSNKIYIVPVNGVETVSIAFIVPAGSTSEDKEYAGCAHLLEHIVFKGTKRYDEFSLKYELEVFGGSLNAFTTKDFTVYYARVPYFHFEKAVDILGELVFSPLIEEEAVNLEKSVVIEEIKSYNEDHLTRVHDLFAESILKEPYSRPISGYEETVKKIDADVLKKFHQKHYGSIKVLVVGKVTDDLLKTIANILRNDKPVSENNLKVNFSNPSNAYEARSNITQVHMITGTPIEIGLEDKRYPALLVLNTLLGSGMSSLLFNTIREKLGLVYEIDTVGNFWKESSLIGIYASTSTEKFPRYVQEINTILKRATIEKHYFEYGKKRLIGKLQMITESVPSVFAYVLEFLISRSEPLPIERLFEKIESVEYNHVQNLWREICENRWHWTCIIPHGEERLMKEL